MGTDHPTLVATGRQYLAGIEVFKRFTKLVASDLLTIPAVRGIELDAESGELMFGYLHADFCIKYVFKYATRSVFHCCAELVANDPLFEYAKETRPRFLFDVEGRRINDKGEVQAETIDKDHVLLLCLLLGAPFQPIK